MNHLLLSLRLRYCSGRNSFVEWLSPEPNLIWPNFLFTHFSLYAFSSCIQILSLLCIILHSRVTSLSFVWCAELNFITIFSTIRVKYTHTTHTHRYGMRELEQCNEQSTGYSQFNADMRQLNECDRTMASAFTRTYRIGFIVSSHMTYGTRPLFNQFFHSNWILLLSTQNAKTRTNGKSQFFFISYTCNSNWHISRTTHC